MPSRHRPLAVAAAIGVLASAAAAQFPSDAQVQAAVNVVYDHQGLIEYCADKGWATADDVAAVRLQTKTVMEHMGAAENATALSYEAQGRRGVILGRQFIGLMRMDSKTHPEIVAEGQTMAFADNARAQGLTERVLCGQITAQVQAQVELLRHAGG